MKLRLNLTLIVLIIFSSCTSNDDFETKESQSPISNELRSVNGIWKPIKTVRICSDGSEKIFNFNSCLQKSRLSISSNSNFEWSVFFDGSGNCVEADNYVGTWEFDGEYLKLTENSENVIAFYTVFDVSKDRLLLGHYTDNCFCYEENPPTPNYTEYIRVKK